MAYGSVQAVLKSVGAEWLREVARDPRIQTYLYQTGKQATRAAIGRIKEQVSSPYAWLNSFDPIIDPVLEGMRDELLDQARPYASKAALLMAGGGVLFGWIIGRGRRRAYERGRLAARG